MKACNYKPTEYEAKFKHSFLRGLDFKDLYIISELGKGKKLTEISANLGLYQSAVTHRIKRHVELIGSIYSKNKCVVVLSEEGKTLAKKFSMVLDLFVG